MRLHSLTSRTIGASSLIVFAFCPPALAQIEFAKSTIRVRTANEVTPAAAAPEVQQPTVHPLTQPDAVSPGPVYAAPQNPAPSVAAPAPIATRPVHHAPVQLPRMPITRQPVRQASYEESAPMPPQGRAQFSGRAPSHVGVYSSSSARTTLSKLPSPAPVQTKPAGLPTIPRGKPFQATQSEPVISPYMNLYRSDREGSTPLNYMTLVRPQLDQLEANRQQSAELQKLRGQLQNMSSGASGGMQSPRMGSSARYMDTAQFYGKMHR